MPTNQIRGHVYANADRRGFRWWCYEVLDYSRPEGKQLLISGLTTDWQLSMDSALEHVRDFRAGVPRKRMRCPLVPQLTPQELIR